jgi:FtsZ-binding cell division protein ZapB
MSTEHEQIVDILALLYPETESVPREERIQKMVELFDTAQSARSALHVAKKHVRDLERAWQQSQSRDDLRGAV